MLDMLLYLNVNLKKCATHHIPDLAPTGIKPVSEFKEKPPKTDFQLMTSSSIMLLKSGRRASQNCFISITSKNSVIVAKCALTNTMNMLTNNCVSLL